MKKIYVIGIGYKPFDKKTREIILNSEVILANQRLFEVFKGYDEFESAKDKIKLINNVNQTIEFIHSLLVTCHSSLLIVLLASGDPMFFGIGRRAIREFGKDAVEIIPDLSCIQLAFARIKESWDDAFLISLHGGPDPEKRRKLPYEITDIPALLERYGKIAILTDKENNPAEIAKVLNLSLVTRHLSLTIYVCERMGYPDEKITSGAPAEIAEMSFGEPNVVIILKNRNELCVMSNEYKEKEIKLETCHASRITHHEFKFGLKEEEIIHSRGLITKDEVRAVAIYKLRLPQKGVFWDIGAGSGSVSIEVSRLYPELKVYAIEKDEEQISNIKENKSRFGAFNIQIIKGKAPDVLSAIPSPQRVFIGGTGGRLKETIEFIAKTSAEIIVINAATIETLNDAILYLVNNGFRVEVSEVSISRSKIIAGKRHMNALNPIFIIRGERQI